jgi:hypothetical protein
MKTRIFILIAVISSLIAITSCNKDDKSLYSVSTMGNMINGQFLCDGGDIYNVVKNDCTVKLDTLSRFLGAFKVLNQTSGKTKEYDVELMDYTIPIHKAPIKFSTSSAEELVNDPINLAQGWLAGGYFNMLFGITMKYGSTTKHLINLQYNDVKSNKDTLYFQLKHNGYGEVYSSTSSATSQIQYGEGYATFPISQLMPSGKTSVYVTVSWDWYSNEEGSISSTTVETHKSTALFTWPVQ